MEPTEKLQIMRHTRRKARILGVTTPPEEKVFEHQTPSSTQVSYTFPTPWTHTLDQLNKLGICTNYAFAAGYGSSDVVCPNLRHAHGYEAYHFETTRDKFVKCNSHDPLSILMEHVNFTDTLDARPSIETVCEALLEIVTSVLRHVTWYEFRDCTNPNSHRFWQFMSKNLGSEPLIIPTSTTTLEGCPDLGAYKVTGWLEVRLDPDKRTIDVWPSNDLPEWWQTEPIEPPRCTHRARLDAQQFYTLEELLDLGRIVPTPNDDLPIAFPCETSHPINLDGNTDWDWHTFELVATYLMGSAETTGCQLPLATYRSQTDGRIIYGTNMEYYQVSAGKWQLIPFHGNGRTNCRAQLHQIVALHLKTWRNVMLKIG